MASVMRASLPQWADKDPELAEALALGDRRHPCDPRRHLAVDFGPAPVDDPDPVGMALVDLRGSIGDPEAAVEAVAAALRAGASPETVRRSLEEVRRD